MTSRQTQNRPDRFPDTRWSLVIAAKGEDEPAAQRAFGELCQIYWYPIYCYFRNAVKTASEAEDLTQGFFAEVIRRGTFAEAAEERGKLRAYLLSSARNYLNSHRRSQSAAKRGGGARPISIDAALAEKQFALEPRDGASPDLLFERAWARTLLDRIRGQVADSYRSSGKGEIYEALEAFIQDASGEPPYLDVAERLGVSAGSLRVTVFRMRQKFRSLLEREIADTVADPGDLEAELGHLLGLFSN